MEGQCCGRSSADHPESTGPDPPPVCNLDRILLEDIAESAVVSTPDGSPVPTPLGVDQGRGDTSLLALAVARSADELDHRRGGRAVALIAAVINWLGAADAHRFEFGSARERPAVRRLTSSSHRSASRHTESRRAESECWGGPAFESTGASTLAWRCGMDYRPVLLDRRRFLKGAAFAGTAAALAACSPSGGGATFTFAPASAPPASPPLATGARVGSCSG